MSKAQRFVYRTYPNAVSRVYSAKRLIFLLRELLRQNPAIIKRHAADVLGTAIWKLTEAETRKYETRYCSKAVWDSRNSIQQKLNHEHVFQKSTMAAALLKCAPEEVEGILENAVACTVFEREHRKLPKKLEKLDGWERYKWAGIVVVDAKQTIDPSNPVYVQETV
jgi:hypothetical protein